MGMMYPRKIEIRRLKTIAGTSDAIGPVGYSGAEDSPTSAEGYDVLFSGIKASIQASDTGRKKDNALPGDVTFAPTWRIYIPKRALALGSVRDRDIIADDEQYRYQVGQAYFNLLGYQLICIRLEA